MNLSMNEVEATAKKAARGVGYSWGLAEEAGKATRWLCSCGADGCGALAGLLKQIDGMDMTGWSPKVGNKLWSAPGGMLCPLVTGAAISDRPHVIKDKDIQLGAIAAPLLLAPFAALLAREFDKPVEITIGSLTLCTDGDQLSSTGAAPQTAQSASVGFGGSIAPPYTLRQRADPDPDVWQVLLAFAHRTYAPATEESRLKGAGADLSDND